MHNCDYVAPCPMEWEKLELLNNRPDVRHCKVCSKHVHLTDNIDDLEFAMAVDYCVAIPLKLVQAHPSIDEDFVRARTQTKTHLVGAIKAPK